MWRFSLLFLAGSLAAVPGGFAAVLPTDTSFIHPPADCRILKIIHGWPDAAASQDALIGSLKTQGFGGAVCNVSFAHYLQSTQEWTSFKRGIQMARDAGFAMWLYDERGYPSGSAGGQVLQGHPDWEAEGLLAVDRMVGAGPVDLAIPPGELQLAAAFPDRTGKADLARAVDLSSFVREGHLVWEAPSGSWQVLVVTRSRLYDGTHAEGNLHEALPYPNLLRPEPTARFLELTHNRYALELGPDLGRWFMGTFTDEPSLMSMFLRRMPWRPIPWSPGLPEHFRKRHGRDLAPLLPMLFLDTDPDPARVRHDFWLTVGDLVASHYFGQIRRTCRMLRVPSGGHLLAEEGLTSHVALYGNFFQCLRELDAPSIDCLTSIPAEVPWHIARLAASAADLEGNPLVMCEVSDHGQVWRPPGDTRPRRRVTEDEIRGTCNRLGVGGINSLTSYYSFDGLDAAALVRLNEWVGRCCAWLRGGRSAGSVAVVYPAESLAAHFKPGNHWALGSPAASRIDVIFRAVMNELFAARREFTVIDSRTLRESRIKQGGLEYGGMRWNAVLLPCVDTMPADAWARIDAFSAAGGLVVAVGDRPGSDGRAFPAPAVCALGDRWFPAESVRPSSGTKPRHTPGTFIRGGEEILLHGQLSRACPADVECRGPASTVRVRHRRIEGREVFLVVNDSGTAWEGRLRFAARGIGEQMDPATGALTGGADPDGVQVRLAPFGALGFRFPLPATTHRLRSRGSDPQPVLSPVAVGSPSVIRGEWVREQFGPAPTEAAGQSRPWRATAVLAKGGVDTFLFVRFLASPAADLTEAKGIAFEVDVPPGQSPATQLLVVLKEEGGGEFLASTPCSLAAPGATRVLLPFSAFTLAGWAADADGVLDIGRIGEIRIGWGGYHGTEGERIEFQTGPPLVVREGARD